LLIERGQMLIRRNPKEEPAPKPVTLGQLIRENSHLGRMFKRHNAPSGHENTILAIGLLPGGRGHAGVVFSGDTIIVVPPDDTVGWFDVQWVPYEGNVVLTA
jgi:hypothetical protein